MCLQSDIICGDSLKIVPTLKDVKLIWADPPDNIGCKYWGYKDSIDDRDYQHWLRTLINVGCDAAPIFWLSFNTRWIAHVMQYGCNIGRDHQGRLFIWHYTFGQNSRTEFVPSYRPILRLMTADVETNPESVYVPSARQLKYNDKRANPKGKMPDDVWEFSRVCGTHNERKKWHPCQHPKALLRRIVEFSTKPGDLVVDMFAGSGNMAEVCEELDRPCIAIDISPYYCKQIRKGK